MILSTQPLYSKNNDLLISVGTDFTSKNILGSYKNLKFNDRSNINFNLKYSKKQLLSYLSLNIVNDDQIKFDNSFAKYQMGIANFTIGKIDRIWSFSSKSSLILSSNARPLEAISVHLENKFNKYWLPSNAKWSIEMIHGSTKQSYNRKSSFYTGARVLFSPTARLGFELFQSSQWSNDKNKYNASTVGALFFGNSNNGNNANINKMAGFGISYSIPFNESNYRIYGQAVGEDEAGNLPSCYGFISGIELSLPKIKFPTITTIELIDTRVPYSTNGNCGPNTMYNNSNYNYVNYDLVLGAPIDSEAISLEFFGKSQLNENLDFNYTIKLLTINDKDYLYNRLSTKRSSGSISALGISWKKNKISISGNVTRQNITLDKANISRGAVFSLTSSLVF
ncbi:capsule assembly Wzi family protein [Amylibacter sp.]|nr:capsule assembly Wzi family protein [Amylibacter sp.]